MRIGIPNFTTPQPPSLLYGFVTTSGNHGGDATSGSWQTVALNTERIDTGNNGTLSSNQITLLAGTYRFRGRVCLYAIDYCQSRLYNVSDGAAFTEQFSPNNFFANASFVGGWAECIGRIAIASNKIVRLEYRCSVSVGTFGRGLATSFGDECYATLEFWREPS